MIVHHEENGQIWWIHSDPEPDAIVDLLTQKQAVHVPAIKLPEVVVRDANGKPVIENGKVLRASPGYSQPEVTHEYHMVVVNEDGTKTVTDRPKLPIGDVDIAADGKDAFVLRDLPKPCSLILDGEAIEITDGRLEFATKDAGTYVFEANYPFVDWQVKVIAT